MVMNLLRMSYLISAVVALALDCIQTVGEFDSNQAPSRVRFLLLTIYTFSGGGCCTDLSLHMCFLSKAVVTLVLGSNQTVGESDSNLIRFYLKSDVNG